MSDRVLLDSTGLKVSQPGTDVKTANEAGLIFNSQWAAMSRLLFGHFDINTPGPMDWFAYHDVLYGKTFTHRPLVFSGVIPHNNSTGPWGTNRAASQHIGTAAYFVFWNPSPPVRYVCNVQNDRFRFYINRSFSKSDNIWTKARVYYAIWDHGLG